MAERAAIVTGAGSGIGRVVAEAFDAAGYRVVLSGRRRATLEQTAGAMTGGPLIVEADVSEPDQVERLFARTQDAFGRLDVLFNNAGIFTRAAPIDEINLADWRASLDTNLTGAFLCTRAAFRMMKAQEPRGGRIINNGSISAQVPRPHSAPYAATKHAITGLTKATALDGRPYDIACGQIDIGNAETEMTRGFAESVRQADGSLKAEAVMDVRHVAEAVLYMAGLPLSANVQFMTLAATQMPWIGRG
ncbi:SDR family oxidoreductase [Methylobacterium gregans]|uniref:3-phenylpropionate-dihydrodiol/cinnamic acid-dihydrodiol dehydrogenase n=1 Tax=Methylobacterium gregans TaxID=374424 RepID=A0AA37HMZ8_9HYPH|nr:SDR family oxidoreductase [Methylobacterium gregans]MDQ0520297.1 NAD(P)-dependent dehydrogenase (short-subunit alcohol dehydrogenase family) [Methylobacterium gregans]GJD78504.1 3-phenylpropionate-dihydrodiol/cinnamic acid-dihydrodiol dehydrogenase [Methylobacterium gregans]GLS52700.1 oxidoreductase [Methylobacterium gregans]